MYTRELRTDEDAAEAWVSDRVGSAERNGVHRGGTRGSTESLLSDQLSCYLIECCIVTADPHLKGVFDLMCSRVCASVRVCVLYVRAAVRTDVCSCMNHIYGVRFHAM